MAGARFTIGDRKSTSQRLPKLISKKVEQTCRFAMTPGRASPTFFKISLLCLQLPFPDRIEELVSAMPESSTSTLPMNLAKGARHSCRLNVNLSNTSEKQETSDLPKFKRPKGRVPVLGYKAQRDFEWALSMNGKVGRVTPYAPKPCGHGKLPNYQTAPLFD